MIADYDFGLLAIGPDKTDLRAIAVIAGIRLPKTSAAQLKFTVAVERTRETVTESVFTATPMTFTRNATGIHTATITTSARFDDSHIVTNHFTIKALSPQ